jgi:hypothetical protein
MRESDVKQTLLPTRLCARSNITTQGVPLSEWRVKLCPSAYLCLRHASQSEALARSDRVLGSEIRYDFSIPEPLPLNGGPRLTKFVSDRLAAQLLHLSLASKSRPISQGDYFEQAH